jgi:hypothetical protein
MEALGFSLRARRERSRAAVAAWSAARGLVAAMAMTGMREASTRLGLLRRIPPEAIVEDADPGVVDDLPPGRRELAIELLHWGYGAAGGAAFAALPAGLRRHPAAGPAYGAVVWLLFEAVLDPALGLRWDRLPRERLALLADHLVYGAIVGTGPR